MKIVYYPQRPTRRCGSSRLRVFDIQIWLLRHGVEALITSSPFPSDIIVLQKICNNYLMGLVRNAKKRGIVTVFEEEDRYLCPCVEEVDYVTVDTYARKEWLQKKIPKKLDISVLRTQLDYLSKPLPKRIHRQKKVLNILFFCFPANLKNIELCHNVLINLKKRKKKFTFTFLSGEKARPQYSFHKTLKAKWIPWKLETYSETLQKFDIALAPQIEPEKSDDKLNETIAHNLAVVGSANDASLRWAKETGNEEFICADEEEWLNALEKMWDAKVRNAQLKRTLPWVWKNHSIDAIGQKWLDFFTRILEEKKK